jgi:error-prone DNA polymerase
MGFYAPSQIVRDAREHGVEVRPPDVNHSDWDSTLEEGPRAAERLHEMHRTMRDDLRTTHAIRLGLREIKGLSEEDAKLIMARRSSPLPPRTSFFTSPLEGEVDRQSPKGEGGREGGKQQMLAPIATPLPNPPPSQVGLARLAHDHSQPGQARVAWGREKEEVNSRGEGKYDSVRDVWLRTGLSPRVLERLADADAFNSLGLSRRDALWAAKALGRVGDRDDDLPLFGVTSPRATLSSPLPLAGEVDARSTAGGGSSSATPPPQPSPARGGGSQAAVSGAFALVTSREPDVRLPPMPIGEEVVNDYRFLRLSLRAHPAQFLRADLTRRGILRNEALRTIASGTRVRISGLVTCRQRPGSAKGVVFMTIEDESAVANAIVWPKVFERARPIVLGARYIAVSGRVQSESGVIHVVADELEDLTALLAQLAEHGADIDGLARCDEVRRPIEEMREARAQGGRESRLVKLMREMPELAADLDVTARGSAHAPTRRSG